MEKLLSQYLYNCQSFVKSLSLFVNFSPDLNDFFIRKVVHFYQNTQTSNHLKFTVLILFKQWIVPSRQTSGKNGFSLIILVLDISSGKTGFMVSDMIFISSVVFLPVSRVITCHGGHGAITNITLHWNN